MQQHSSDQTPQNTSSPSTPVNGTGSLVDVSIPNWSDGLRVRRDVLITAALPYANGDLHVGHLAGAYLPADIYRRFRALRGDSVTSICGSDDYGAAIMLSAEKAGKDPSEIVSHYHDRQVTALSDVGINFSNYGSTSRNPHHRHLSQDFFLRLHEKGYFEKSVTRQFFDMERGIFLPDRYVVGTCGHCNADGQNGDQCEQCGQLLDTDTLLNAKSTISGRPAIGRETTHWFLDLTKLAPDVVQWLEHATVRENTRKYVQSLIDSGLVKRSMTRDIPWGIPVPLNDPDAMNKVLYVWFDAPIGYISNTKQYCDQLPDGDSKFKSLWHSNNSQLFHFIGEDNTIFHAVVWVAMLSAQEGYRLPTGVIVNNFMNIKAALSDDSEKMSKSRGTAVWINDYVQKGGNSELLRYYLTINAPENARTVFNVNDLEQRSRTEVANVIGNLVHRVATFNKTQFGSQCPPIDPAVFTDADRKFVGLLEKTHQDVTQCLETFSFRQGLEKVMEFGRECNRYLGEKKPWATKAADPAGTANTIGLCLNACRGIATMLSPYMPDTGRKIFNILNLNPDTQSWWDAAKGLPPKHSLGEPEILFPQENKR